MIHPFENYCILPTEFGNFRMYDTKDEEICLLSYSPLENLGEKPLLRIHSSCIASEVFGAKDCDCADQLHEAMKIIASEGRGLIIHIHQEGRGHGLSRKIQAVSLMQKENCDTVESFTKLGLDLDPRDYSVALDILKQLGINSVRLISNNPRKINFLTKFGIDVEQIHTHPKIRLENKDYLYSKNLKLGHSLPLEINEKSDTIYFYHSDEKWGEFANFSIHAIYIDGKIWRTVEHFYQAQKFHNTDFEETIRLQATPMQAKQKAHELLKEHPAENWTYIKEKIMYKGLYAKFTQNPELGKLLISTGNKNLVERSDNDYYWGDGKDKSGKNRLGRLLIRLRDEIKGFDKVTQEKHKNNIKNYFKIKNELHLLGTGAEGIVFTDKIHVYKSFFNIINDDWNFLKSIYRLFDMNPMLYNIELFENNEFRFIRYKYDESIPIAKVNPDKIIELLRFCKSSKFVLVNIKPKNFIQLTDGNIKLIDYGRSIKPFTQADFINSTKRAFLLWKYPQMENDEFQNITSIINNGKIPKEIEGWESFWDRIKQ